MAFPPRRPGHPPTRAAGALVLGLLAAPALPLCAQEPGALFGRVTYAGTGEGIAGVLVTLPTLHLGRLTDAEGRFSLAGVAPGRHPVVTTLLGCHLATRAVELDAGQRREVDFVLDPPVLDLEGFVVTALAADASAGEAPFAVGRLDPGATAATPALADLLRGRFAGARVVQGSGQPGDPASITLRGPTSIQGGQGPLIVVDGIVTAGVPTLDPLDVEHVEVLRGAGAAAQYGARGQAGVIEITTRRGPTAGPGGDGPLVVVDGSADGRTLAEIDPRTIEDIRMFEGAAAAVLYGSGAERGVIHVTTRGAPAEAARPPFCAEASGG